MNSINLIGNICRDLELKSTNSGKNVCSFNVAVKRPFSKDTTDFFTVVAWNGLAEVICKYCSKGQKIGVTGIMTTRDWEDKDSNKRIAYEVIANDITFIGKGNVGQSGETSTDEDSSYVLPDGFMPGPADDDLPF